jgi:Asp-tRNA(Asn)/Glu-tRNA(Gln) amidotransferase A subunit family amidase
MGALDLAEAIRSGEVSSQEVVEVAQVIGPCYREDPCLDAAAAVEDRAGIITPIDPR